jgi:outer membrane protein OmpA-like peptidoglycan-associated protein
MRSSSRFAIALALSAAAVLCGCSLPQAEPPPVPPPVSAAPLPAGPAGAWTWSPELESAGTRLRAALSGSGAEISQTPDQRLWISLPAAAAFPAGRAAVSPAATPWLDRVAASVRSLPRAQVQIVGPADARGGAALAVDRAASARDWMVMRGVPAHRMVVTGQDPRGRSPTGEARLHIFVGERTPR